MAANTATIRVVSKDEATATLKRIQGQVDDLSRTLSNFGRTVAGGLSVGTLIAAFKSIIGALDNLDEASQALGVSAVALAEYRRAASESGVSAEKFDAALTRLNVKFVDAAGGGKESAAAFRTMGIELRSGSGQLKNTEELLGEVANKFQGYRDGAEKSALAVALFGRAGAALIPFLNQGADGLRKFAGVTDEAVKAGVEMQKQFDQLKGETQALGTSLAVSLVPFLLKTIQEFRAAKEAAGGFGGALLLLARQSGETLEDPGQKIEALTGKLKELRKEGNFSAADFLKFGSKEGRDQFNAGAIKSIETELDFLKKLRIQRVLTANRDTDFGREGFRFLRTAPIIPKDTGGGGKSAGESFLETLSKQVEKAELNEFAALRLEAALKGVAKAAEPYIQRLEEAKNLQQAITLYVKDQEQIEKRRAEAEHFTQELQDRVRLLAEEADMIGRSELAQRQLSAARDIDLRLRERLSKLEPDDPLAAQARQEAASAKRAAAINIETAAINRSRVALQDMLAELETETREIGLSTSARQRAVLLRNLEKSGIDASSEAYRAQLELIERIADATQKNEDRKQLQTDIESLSRSTAELIGEFSKTGDINAFFKNLASRLLDLTTELLVVRPLMLEFQKILTGQANAQPGAGSLIGLLASFFGGGGVSAPTSTGSVIGAGGVEIYAKGSDYVPRTGLAIVHKGEKIIPANENRAWNSSGSVINISVQGSVTNENAGRLGATVARTIAANSRRYN